VSLERGPAAGAPPPYVSRASTRARGCDRRWPAERGVGALTGRRRGATAEVRVRLPCGRPSICREIVAREPAARPFGSPAATILPPKSLRLDGTRLGRLGRHVKESPADDRRPTRRFADHAHGERTTPVRTAEHASRWGRCCPPHTPTLWRRRCAVE